MQIIVRFFAAAIGIPLFAAAIAVGYWRHQVRTAQLAAGPLPVLATAAGRERVADQLRQEFAERDAETFAPTDRDALSAVPGRPTVKPGEPQLIPTPALDPTPGARRSW